MAAAAVPDPTLIEGQTITGDIAGTFTDPDGGALTYGARSSHAGVATAPLSGNELSVTGVTSSAAAITPTATEPGGLSASPSLAVEVPAATARITVQRSAHSVAVTPTFDTLTGAGGHSPSRGRGAGRGRPHRQTWSTRHPQVVTATARTTRRWPWARFRTTRSGSAVR